MYLKCKDVNFFHFSSQFEFFYGFYISSLRTSCIYHFEERLDFILRSFRYWIVYYNNTILHYITPRTGFPLNGYHEYQYLYGYALTRASYRPSRLVRSGDNDIIIIINPNNIYNIEVVGCVQDNYCSAITDPYYYNITV